METDFSKDILEKIKKDGIKPKSRWHFVLKDYVVWLMFAVSIILGAVSFSIVLHFLGINDWDAYYRINNNVLEFALRTLPYFWLAGFLLFLVVSYFYLKHTNKGYRYEFAKVASLNVALSFVCGCILYSSGAGRVFENEFAERSPLYKGIRSRQEEVWLSPERGVIIGKVIEIYDDGDYYELDDPRHVIWTVNVADAQYMRGFTVQEGFMVKVFGVAEADEYFIAQEIRPLMRGRDQEIPLFPRFGK